MRFKKIQKIQLYFTMIVLIISACASYIVPKFVGYKGCQAYSEMLEQCAPFKCQQKIPGFKDASGADKEVTVGRQIVGYVQDEYYAIKTCHTVEMDDISKPEIKDCSYSEETQNQVAKKSAVLFGTEIVPGSQQLDSSALDKMRASYIKRSQKQESECKQVTG